MNMRKLFTLIALLLLFASTSSAEFVNATQKNIKAVAVVSGENRGATINITVIVTPGNGRVFVSTLPYTEIDMQGSAQLAAITACDLTGKDFLKYDFFYIIEAEAPIVGGPSAGGIMTVATIAALLDLPIRKDVFMTGMIYPDGFIGPVGGIPYKLEAAAESGAKIFLIPKGQRYVEVEETKRIQRGPFVLITTETKTVDVVDYGRKLGVTVIEVETVNEALKYFTGYEIRRSEGKIDLSQYSYLLKKLADYMRERSERIYSEFEKVADRDVKENIDKRLEEARKNYERGNYYTSTSQYFTANIFMRAEIYRKTLNDENFEREVKTIEEEIEAVRGSLNQEYGLIAMQLVGAAEERLGRAEQYLEKARTSENFEEAALYLAFAKERVESAKVWLSLLPEIREDVPIKKEEVVRRAQFYLSTAESLLVYSKSIGGFSRLLFGENSAESSLELSKKLYSQGYYFGSIFASIDSMVKSAVAIELIGAKSLEEKISAARDSARASLSEAEKVTPILAIAYFEYGETSEGVYKLIYYKLSERIAKLMLNLAGGGEVELVKSEYVLPETTPAVENVGERIYESVKKSVEIPGFEIIVGVVAASLAVYARRKAR